MDHNIDYNHQLNNKINYLKKTLGNNNATEDLRRFAHNLRNYEYHGNYYNIFSKFLLKAEVIKSIYELCTQSSNCTYIKNILYNSLDLNLKLYDDNNSKADIITHLANYIFALNKEQNFLIITLQTKNTDLLIILEKLPVKISAQTIRLMSNLLAECLSNKLDNKQIYKKLTNNLNYIKKCPIKLHCIDNHYNETINKDQNTNIRIFNYYNKKYILGYSKLEHSKNEKINFYGFNIICSISYILAKTSYYIDLNNKKIIHIDNNKQSSNTIFKNNINNIIEYSILRLTNNDKYVIGALDRKFNLNYRIKYQPNEIKQININELDYNGLRNLKNLISFRIKKVSKLNEYSNKLSNDNFNSYIQKNDKLIPQLALEQAKLTRAKAFFNKAQQLDKKSKYQEAIIFYSKTIELDSKFKEAYFYRANNYYNLKKYRKAIEDYSNAINNDPNYYEAYHKRGLSYAEIKSLDKAIIDFNSAIKLKEVA